MAVTLLGREALLAVLAGHGRVIVVNRTSPRLGLRVMAAAIARHAAADVQCESAFGLDLDSGESEILDALPAATGALAAVEAVLRLAAPESGVFGDVYVTSPVEPPTAARAWEPRAPKARLAPRKPPARLARSARLAHWHRGRDRRSWPDWPAGWHGRD